MATWPERLARGSSVPTPDEARGRIVGLGVVVNLMGGDETGAPTHRIGVGDVACDSDECVRARAHTAPQERYKSHEMYLRNLQGAKAVRQRITLVVISGKKAGMEKPISTRTAENHKARIMSLLGISTTAALVHYAIRHGIVSPG